METRASKHRSSPDARRLEGIVAAAFDAIIAVNDAQEVVLFNPGAERMFGLAAAEAIGQDLSRFIPDRFRATHADHVRQFTQTGAFNRRMGLLGAASGLRANGEEFHVEASMSQATVGGERLATVILRDITEREVAVAALLDARRRMEGIVASAMDALIAVDDDQRIMLFNPAAERMFGVAAAHAVGSSGSFPNGSGRGTPNTSAVSSRPVSPAAAPARSARSAASEPTARSFRSKRRSPR
jgi:PAS domain S-box-containing protein